MTLAREFYCGNEIELNRIDDFEQNYNKTRALTWYTSDSFVYRLLNKAIRTENFDLLFACRFFIVDLHNQLDSLQTQFKEHVRLCGKDTLTLYRGQHMMMDDFEKLRDNIGKLISTNSFLSTSSCSEVAMIYAGSDVSHPTMYSVLFQITIDINASSKENQHPFADISAYSQFTDEQEVLFSLGAMFRIEDVVNES